MNHLRCDCGAECTNGLAFCEACRAKATISLEFVPVYFRNLARWKPTRTKVTEKQSASRQPTLGGRPAADPVSRALEWAGNDLVKRAAMLHTERGVELPVAIDEPSQIDALCRMFNEHLTTIGTLPWAGQFLRELERTEKRLRSLTETLVPGWYAGKCDRCEHPTYVIPGLTWVHCGGCGNRSYARDHLEVILKEADAIGWTATPKRLAEAIVALVDTEDSVESLRKRIAVWATRYPERITTIQRERVTAGIRQQYGPKQHKFGEVFIVLTSSTVTTKQVSA